MQTIYISNTKEIKKLQRELENKLKLKITLKNKMLTIEGDALKEYEASIIIEAVNAGFNLNQSLLLLSDEYSLRQIFIKNSTRRKNLHDVKARIIGTEGKTKRTIESLGECYIIVKDSIVYLLAPADKVEYITTAITNLIKGSKQSNVYKFLEERNAQEKINLNEDLGIKNKD